MKQFFINIWKYLFSASKKRISNLTTSYNNIEQYLFNIVTAMALQTDINQIHCDTDDKKYYVIVGNRTVIIDGTTNKVFILIEPNEDLSECEKTTCPFLIRDSVVTDLIDILVKRKHIHTEKIYAKIISYETEFLNTFEQKMKDETQNLS